MPERDRRPEAQYEFLQTHSVADAKRNAVAVIHEAEPANVGGRLVGMRDHGHYVFGDLRDQTGGMQFIAEEGVTPALDELRARSPGDWLGLEGHLGKSRRGAPSLFVKDWVTLARTDTPFPYKQGLQDPEIRARRRYLDLAVNPDSLRRFQARSAIIHSLRSQLTSQGFVEVETPTLQTLYGGAAARPFETHMNSLDLDLYMRIAPELYLKQCVVGGLERVFEIGKVFRNEGLSPRHNPEFTMMEVYAAYWDGDKQMELTETLVSSAARLLHGGETVIQYQGQSISLERPWPRVPMDQLVSEKIGEEVSVDTDITRLRELCERHGVEVEAIYGTGKLLLELFEATVEDDLVGPIFVTDYPEEVSPLARSHRSRPGYTERFEGFIAGSEICNGFTELNNPRQQYERFKDQEATAEVDDEAMRLDHGYIRALQAGLPPTGGLGIGIDRLVMLLTDTRSIRDVILFPTMRPDDYRVTEYEER